MLSPELVAGIRRVKGVKRLGQRVGNWLTTEEGQQLLGAVCTDTGSVVTNILGNSVCSTSPLNKIKLGNLSAVLKAAALRCPWSQDLSSEGDL